MIINQTNQQQPEQNKKKISKNKISIEFLLSLSAIILHTAARNLRELFQFFMCVLLKQKNRSIFTEKKN